MAFLKSNSAALFCLITGIILLAFGYPEVSSGNNEFQETPARAIWYLVIGLALSVTGIVRLLRNETV